MGEGRRERLGQASREGLSVGTRSKMPEGSEKYSRQGECRWRLLLVDGLRPGIQGDAEHPHRFGDVLELLVAKVFELGGDLAAGLAPGILGQANSAAFRQGFEPSGDIDAVAEQVILLDDNIAQIDTNSEE